MLSICDVVWMGMLQKLDHRQPRFILILGRNGLDCRLYFVTTL